MNNDHQSHSRPAAIGLEPTFFGKVMTFFALAIFSSAAGVYLTMKYFFQYFIDNPALMWNCRGIQF